MSFGISRSRRLAYVRMAAIFIAVVGVAFPPAQAQTRKADSDGTLDLDTFEIVTTGTRTQRLATDLPIRTEVLAPDFFRAAGARDLGAALEYLPGVRSEANCQNCGTAEIKMLGLGAGYNRLLFDGQPLFSGLAAVYGIEQIPTAFIERIEVIKGGASSLYGPGAVAGVINILPKEPVTNHQHYDTSFESMDGESLLSASALSAHVSESGDLAYSFYGQFNDSGAVDLNDDGFSDITEKEFTNLGLNSWFYPNDTGKLSLNYAYSAEQRRGGDRFDLVAHEAQITEELDHTWHRGGIAWDGSNDADLVYHLGASFSYVERDSYYGGVGAVPLPGYAGHDPVEYAEALEESRLLYGYTDTLRSYFDTLFTHSMGDHYVSYGAQYQVDEVFDEKRDQSNRPLRSDGGVANIKGEDPIVDDSYSDLGFFLQDEWMPAPDFTMISGVRADKHSDLDDWVLSPRLAVRRTTDEAFTWRASVATGFRAPEIFDEDFHIEILDDPTRTRNAPDLEEESSISFSTGFVWTPPSGENNWQVDGEVFRTELRDTFFVSDVVREDVNGNPFKERTNSGGSRIQGFELNSAHRLSDRWSFEYGLTYLDAQFDEEQEILPGVFEGSFLETPDWSGVALLRYENEDFADFFLGIVYTGPMKVAREGEGTLNRSTDHFFVVDLTFTKHLHFEVRGKTWHVDLMAGVKNIFDERQGDLTAGPERDTTYFYGPRFPRSFVMSAGIEL